MTATPASLASALAKLASSLFSAAKQIVRRGFDWKDSEGWNDQTPREGTFGV